MNILVDRMEKERNRLAVFLAGYTDKMETFLKSNPGLSSRVSRKFYFKDYTGPELMQIFEMLLERTSMQWTGNASRKWSSISITCMI